MPKVEMARSPFDDQAAQVGAESLPSASLAVDPAADADSHHRFTGRLFRKYLLLILSLVTIALLSSGAISIYFSYQENKSALASLQREKALAAATRIEQYIDQIVKQLVYAALPQLDASDVELRRIEFLKLLRQAPEVTDIAQLDAAGREQISVSRLGMDNINSGRDRSQEPAFRNARKGQQYFGPVYFKKETEPYMTIAIRSSDTGPVTIADVNLKFIWDVVSRIKIGDKGKAYVVDENGFLVADPDIGLVLRKTSMAQLPHVKAAMEKHNADEPAMVSVDLANTEVLTSVAPIESLKWNVFIEQPVAEVYAKLNASILRTAALLIAGLVISALAALLLARGMVRPIRTLDAGARRIGSGELDQKIDVHTGDELEGLANQFNRMSDRLRESYAGLENKVEERTQELKNSLEQQTAISEILRVISSSPTDVQPVLQAVAERAAHLCNAPFAIVLLVDNGMLRPAAHFPADAEVAPRVVSIPFKRTSMAGRAALDGQTIHYADVVPVLDAEYPDMRENVDRVGVRACLAVPLARDGGAYGSIFMSRTEPGLFSPDQVALVETFARQAAIAIDNIRLFNETQEALQTQTATADILKVISTSPTDVQPVFDAIAERAKVLCNAIISAVSRFDGELVHLVAFHGASPDADEAMRSAFPMRPGSESMTARVVRAGAPVQVPDVMLDPAYPLKDEARRSGYSSALAVPMLREGEVVGSIVVARAEAGLFPDQQVRLLQTFADQAAIAIENVRLFNATKEALEQQTAISEILRVISSSPTDVTPVLQAVADSAAHLCDAPFARVLLVEGDSLRLMADHSVKDEPLPRPAALPMKRSLITGRAVLDRQTIHHADIAPLLDTEYPDSHDISLAIHARAVLAVPLIREGGAYGVIFLFRRQPGLFSRNQVALVETFARQAAIAIDNVRLFNETQEALQTQTATADILKVISTSPTDVQPVFDAIAERAKVLCNAIISAVARFDGEWVHLVAYHGVSTEADEAMRSAFPMRPGNNSITARVVSERAPVQIPDVMLDPTYSLKDEARKAGYRSNLAVPMLREGLVIGSINVCRGEPGPFPEQQVRLLQTFADQAAIAIENVRLFNETKEALEQQTAVAEILRVISSSPTDVKPVLDAIAERAARVCDAASASMYLTDGTVLRHLASKGPSPDPVSSVDTVPIDRDSISGRALLERRTIVVDDMLAAEADYPLSFEIAQRHGGRTLVVVPLSADENPFGTIVLRRQEVRPFTERELSLLRTFGDQAAIALKNVGLFEEIQEKSRQVEIASQHKMQFLANMSHELRTPLNAILGYAELLFDGIYGTLEDRVRGVLDRVQHNGRHLLGLINDVLDLSKIDAGQLTLALDSYSMSGLLKSAVASTESLARAKGLALTASVDDDLPLGRGDERRLTQVLLNIVGNAIKFTDQGKVELVATAADGNFTVEVRDTGPGIAESDRARIFDEFQQVDDSSTRTKGGTGLGLAIAKRIVEMHGGTITVDSELGVGSTFRVVVPILVEQQREAA